MKTVSSLISLFLLIISLSACGQEKKNSAATTSSSTAYNKLTKEEEQVIIYKGTEAPYSGKLLNNKQKGIYICKRCNSPLYRSEDKFDSECGWPSFDDEIKGSVMKIRDADGHRIEIICSKCKGHLGHVFYGEGFTQKNTRHCVNSVSMAFIPDKAR